MSDFSSQDENSFNNFPNDDEEQQLQNELEEMELGKVLQGKTKIILENEMNLLKNQIKSKIDKKKIEQKYTDLNKAKQKAEPKEFSALLKPKKKEKIVTEEKFRRDPRFDDMSGKFNEEMYNKNYDFVKDKSKEYLEKIKDFKIKNNKKKNKIDEGHYELMKKQINFVKGWMKSKQFEETKEKVKKEFKHENKERIEKGMNPIFVKDSVMKKVVNDVQKGKRNVEEEKEFLKKKKHREVVKIVKSELNFKSIMKK